MVSNWLTDVRRRGADLYAMNEGDEVQYFSFEGKDHFRFSLEIDYALQEITVQITDPKTTGMEVENLALTAANLGALARLMCSGLPFSTTGGHLPRVPAPGARA